MFCADVAVAEAVQRIKKGLEAEGMGDLGSEIVDGGTARGTLEEVAVRIRKQFRGKRIMVPKILHRNGKRQYRELNYEADVLQPFMDMLGLEVARALQFFFTSTQHNQIHHIVLSGGSAAIPGVDEAVSKRVQVNTIIANPFVNMQVSGKIKPKALTQDAPSLMVACGLAMRRFDP